MSLCFLHLCNRSSWSWGSIVTICSSSPWSIDQSSPWIMTWLSREYTGWVQSTRASAGLTWKHPTKGLWSRVRTTAVAYWCCVLTSDQALKVLTEKRWDLLKKTLKSSLDINLHLWLLFYCFVGVKSDSIAVDWVGKNLYWVDGLVGQILAVKLSNTIMRSQDFTVVLGENLEQPSSLILLPNKG